VRERLRCYRRAGVTTVHLEPAGADVGARIHTLGRVMDLLRDVNAHPADNSDDLRDSGSAHAQGGPGTAA
jgi:hypothetical protein